MWPLCQCLALAAAFTLLMRRTRGRHTPLRLCLLAAFAGAAAGAALLDILLRLPAWLDTGRPWTALLGGVNALGALIGLTATYAHLARLRGIKPTIALDLLAPSLGALILFGRLGCFFGGCDFGRVTVLPWAVHYPAGSPAFTDHLTRRLILPTDNRSLPVHPVQLYEALLGVAVAALALTIERREFRPGIATGAVAATYAAGRLYLDGLRGDITHRWGPWSPTQWLAAAILLTVIAAPLTRRWTARTPHEHPVGR